MIAKQIAGLVERRIGRYRACQNIPAGQPWPISAVA